MVSWKWYIWKMRNGYGYEFGGYGEYRKKRVAWRRTRTSSSTYASAAKVKREKIPFLLFWRAKYYPLKFYFILLGSYDLTYCFHGSSSFLARTNITLRVALNLIWQRNIGSIILTIHTKQSNKQRRIKTKKTEYEKENKNAPVNLPESSSKT